MADQRAVDGALAQGVSAIESTYNDLQGHFRRLEGDLSTIGSSWQGSASVQFTQLMQQWQDNAANVRASSRVQGVDTLSTTWPTASVRSS